jgi:AcrR family transcriptional regulator
MSHEPEVAATVYLAGTLDAAERERFEEHLLACEECWREVQLGHRGRALAESLREVAPQRLRERVRTAVAATSRSDRRRRRRPMVAAAVAATVVAVVAAAVLANQRPTDQPRVIAAAVASYRAGGLQGAPLSGVRPPAARLGDLRWQGAERGRLAGLEVVAHDYRDSAGRRVTLLVADRSFPEAIGAGHPPGVQTWTAEVDEVVLLCAERPSPSLLLGTDQEVVLAAAARLGLH